MKVHSSESRKLQVKVGVEYIRYMQKEQFLVINNKWPKLTGLS